ncbi:MAG: helix-turn-helix domain-containing protein [FCB group bacterium]|nr:helix-turn-helix domain-containing protein [FCB group bacterium]
MPPQDEAQILTVKEIAQLLRKKERTIREMCYNHQIPHYKVGRTILFSVSKIMEWMEKDCMVEARVVHSRKQNRDHQGNSSPPAISCGNRAVTASSGR